MKKYLLFTVGAILSLFGYLVFFCALAEMTTVPDPKISSSEYVIYIIFFLGALPFICGIALCIFTSREWLKKWWNSRKFKGKHSCAEVIEEKPVNPATANLKCIADVVPIVIAIIGIFMVVLFSDSIVSWIGIPSNWKWPILLAIMFAVVVGAILGKKILNKILQMLFPDKQ